ncbi:site-specific integrase [Cupriavidus pinatubonensis]|uniref:site-specific integrase n=1 Tax=Cupriavidus pinatubonensis TaxID=248026 RepID=UPI001C72C5B9|nr:site-specific integrase [Cupriavidus pinatubonensis]QYY30283.1 site-specific integrase [Cupriavidus pinatubonensis]
MASVIKVGNKWRAQVRRKGHPPVTRTFEKKSHAERWAQDVESQLRGGGFADDRKLAEFTIRRLIEDYEEEVGKLRPIGRSKSGALAMLKRHIGDTSLARLSEASVVDYAKRRKAMGAGGVTVAMEFTYLDGVLEMARSLWKLPLPPSPIAAARKNMRYLGLIGKSKKRDRRPTEAEINAICAWFEKKPRQRVPMPDIIRFAIASAMRAGEITRLRWDDIHEDDKTILIRDRKDPEEKIGNDQTVPLLGDAWAIVQRQPRKGELIFPYNERTFSTLFPRACNDLGIEDLRFHDLRHEGVSRLFEAGYSIEQVALVSGHRDWKQLQRYTQIKAKNLHRESEPAKSERKRHQRPGAEIFGFALRRSRTGA